MDKAASVTSLASVGLTAFGDVTKGQGTAAGDDYRAATLENTANVLRVKAVQTGAVMSEQLSQTLGSLDALRAASHADPTSPTGAAIRNTAESRGLTSKSIAVDNIVQQASQDALDAAFMRQSAKTALLGGELGAGADILKGLASFATSSTGQALGSAALALLPVGL